MATCGSVGRALVRQFARTVSGHNTLPKAVIGRLLEGLAKRRNPRRSPLQCICRQEYSLCPCRLFLAVSDCIDRKSLTLAYREAVRRQYHEIFRQVYAFDIGPRCRRIRPVVSSESSGSRGGRRPGGYSSEYATASERRQLPLDTGRQRDGELRKFPFFARREQYERRSPLCPRSR